MPGFFIGPGWRMLSPSWDSILMTSAPNSARIWVANGPMTTLVRSRTFTPSNGPGICVNLFGLDFCGADEFTPGIELLAHEAAERSRIQRVHFESKCSEPVPYVGLRKAGEGFLRQPCHDRLRRAGRCEQAVP